MTDWNRSIIPFPFPYYFFICAVKYSSVN